MSSKKNLNNKKREENLSNTKVNLKDKKNIIITILLCIILVLILLLCYFVFSKKDNLNGELCSAATIKEVPIEPKYQYINYQGFKFKMPLEWSFVSNDNKYEISDNESKILITFNNIDLNFDEFKKEDYQKNYLEVLQTTDNIKINNSGIREKNDVNYYIFEGTKDSYDYTLIAIGNDSKTILIGTIFQDKVAYNNLLNSVLDFALSYIK